MPKLKMKLPQTHTALLASTDITWLPQVPKPLQECSQHHSLPFWARSDCMCTDPSKQANFWHTSNYCWAHKLGIPPFTVLKWPEQVGALRDVGVYVVQRQSKRKSCGAWHASLPVFHCIETLLQTKENQVQFSTSAWENLILILLVLILSILATSHLYLAV